MFLVPYLYARGPSLDECLEKVLQSKNVNKTQNLSFSVESTSNIQQVRSFESRKSNKTFEIETISYMEDHNSYLDNKDEESIETVRSPSFQVQEQNDFCNFEGSAQIRKIQKTRNVEIKKVQKEDISTLTHIEKDSHNEVSIIEESRPKLNFPKATKPCTCNADTDVLFLQSILPDMKMLSAENKIEFKIQVQKYLKSLLYPKNTIKND